MTITVEDILKESARREEAFAEPFDPVTGEHSLGDRVKVVIDGCPLGNEQWLPKDMSKLKLVGDLRRIGWDAYADSLGADDGGDMLLKTWLKLRSKYDFPFWCAMFCYIKNKAGGPDVTLRLNKGQRILVDAFEKQRLAGKPIRVILLKARQFGGSTACEAYICWIMTCHKTSTNTVIATHANAVSATVRAMMTKMLDNLPMWMLYPIGAEYNPNEEKMRSFEGQQSIQYIPSRKCKVRIATASNPEAMRSEDVALAHLSEVALWADTTLLHPEDYVDAVLSGILPKPYTMKVMESTAKGLNFFHREWCDAKKGIGEYTPVFVGWKSIENDRIPFDSDEEKTAFAKWLLDNRHQKEAPDRRSESGAYLWQQWEQGADLLSLHWYVTERRSKSGHQHMASEAPSNDIEAFASTGEELFDEVLVEKLRNGCKLPRMVGEIQGDATKGRDVLNGVHFAEDKTGDLLVWEEPETYEGERCLNRYLVTVDIGGTSNGADWSVIMVLDRYWMIEGGKPSVVAQWYGHIDHDLLAWKAAQIAKWYDNALLVIESNTLDKERDVYADVSDFILNRVKGVYDNLYERARSQEDIANNNPVKYGFHTNRQTKPMIIKNLQECVRDMLWVERDERCLDELKTYEHNGVRYEAKQGLHDDLLMTRAIGLWVCYNEMEEPKMVSTEAVGRDNSMSSRGLI